MPVKSSESVQTAFRHIKVERFALINSTYMKNPA